MKLRYNLQFFAEGDSNGNSTDSNSINTTSDSNVGNSVDCSNNGSDKEIDMQAFADIISEKDKQIEELQKDIAELKKSNANLIVKVNAAANPPEQKKSFEENLLDMVGAKPRKE